MITSDRIKRAKDLLSSLGVDAVLVTREADICYLTRYPAHESWLLVTAQKSFYVTDGRYIEEVKKGISGVVPVDFKRSLFEKIIELCRGAGVRALALDEQNISLYQFRRLKAICGNKIKLVPANSITERLRMVKDTGEIKIIREALELNLKAYQMVKPRLKPGVRESDILAYLENFMRQHGVCFAFDPIIASGPNSAYPHARVTSRQLCSKEPVLIDLGVGLKGYKSDLTRMFFLDKMPASYKDVLDKVRGASEAALKMIRPGIKAKDVDAAARNYLKEQGLAEYFTHSLGHGVGLEVHEAPGLSASSNVVLEENMVFTVEPGVYFPGKYGIRLEEMVRVTKKGCEVLSVDHDQ